MSAQITSRHVVPINGDRELHVISEGKTGRVKFSMKLISSPSYQEREEWYISAREAMRLSLFLAGIQDSMRRVDIDDDDTTPVEIPVKRFKTEEKE